MTDAPPPSIPPRSRPHAPGTAARPVRPVAGQHPDAVTSDPSGLEELAADHQAAAQPAGPAGAVKVPRRTASSTRQVPAPADPSATDGLGAALPAQSVMPPLTPARLTPARATAATAAPARVHPVAPPVGPEAAPLRSSSAPHRSGVVPGGSGAVPIAAPAGAAPADVGYASPAAGPAPEAVAGPSLSSFAAPPEPASSFAAPADEDEPDAPSALSVAVDQTTAWVRKAATSTGATMSAAYASLTRPRPKDSEMTANPVAPNAAAPRAVPPPLATETVSIGAPRPMTGRIPTVSAGPRRVRLAVSRVDPWSVMKLALLLSFAMGIMGVIAVMVVWATLNGLHVFTTINGLIGKIVGAESNINVLDYVQFSKVVSAATLISVVDVFLLTALATIGAFLYNIAGSLVGGVHVTMTDE